MNHKAIEIQIYFEIAMAIGNELDLQKMLRSALSVYLRKLGCATGMILRFFQDDKKIYHRTCFSIPRNSNENPLYQEIFRQLPAQFTEKQFEKFIDTLPRSGTLDDQRHFHICHLPGFGLIVLIKSGQPLHSRTLYSLRQLNKKLADACNSCVQNQQLEQINTRLNHEIEQRRVAELKLKELLGDLEFKVEERTSALQESKKRYKVLFDNIQDIYFSLDPLGRITEISPSAETILYYRREELIGSHVETLGLSFFERMRFVAQLRKKGKVKDYLLALPDRDGEKHYFSINAILTEMDNQNGQQVIGSLLDITQQYHMEQSKQKLEEQLLNSQKMEALGLLAGGVAHDLNNVLSGIVSYPDFLLTQLDEKSQLRQPITLIRDSGAKAAAIVQDLLTMARRGVIKKNIVNLNTIIKEYLDSPEFDAIMTDHHGLTLDKELSPDLLNMEGSELHLKKALMNLVQNAAEAGAGKISLVTENEYLEGEQAASYNFSEGDYIKLKVIDDGSGISAEDQKRIFEPFYTKKVMGRSGTGLGMSVVWGTVVDHNGHVSIESKPGEQTVIQLLFAATRRKKPAKERARPVSEYLAAGETILVVDDSESQRRIARNILNSLGYLVDVAESGEKAIDLVRQNKPDLVLLDMVMEPGMDGLDTYREINKELPGVKVVIATGYTETKRLDEVLRLGALRCIRKPYLLETVGSVLRQCLA